MAQETSIALPWQSPIELLQDIEKYQQIYQFLYHHGDIIIPPTIYINEESRQVSRQTDKLITIN